MATDGEWRVLELSGGAFTAVRLTTHVSEARGQFPTEAEAQELCDRLNKQE